MSHRFEAQPQDAGVEIRLVGSGGPVATDLWSVVAPAALLPGVDLAQRLVAAESAIADGDTLLVEHRAVAGLSVREAASLGLPAPAPVVAHIESRGTIASAGYAITLEWRRPTGQPVVGARRVGAFLRIGDSWWRVPDALFHIAEAVERLNRAPADDQGARFAAVAALREVLPSAVDAGTAETSGLIGAMTITVADAFSLDLNEDGGSTSLVPILHRSGGAPDEPMLPEERQRAFGEDQFNRFSTVRSVYALGGNWYAVVTPVLRRALAEVRRVQAAPAATKRALFASLRAFLRDALGPDVDDTVLESVFRETPSYAERVVGLGLWKPRVVPWIALAPTDWFGDGGASPGGRGSAGGEPPVPSGIVVGDRRITLSEEEADALRVQVEAAIGAGHPSVPMTVDGASVPVPATVETLAALNDLAAARQPKEKPGPEAKAKTKTAPEVLLIRPNEDEVEVEGAFAPRPAPPREPPAALATPLKPHQAEGLAWLQKAWAMGRSGVLLADDMGLGKTLQGLAFLAWLRAGMADGTIPRAPVAVVAPTGLLQNWRAEADRHLSGAGLGRCTEAFGRGLAALKRPSPDGRPALDTDALAAADWVLTTYEALRDYDRDFGRVRFAALLFDEAQKIKTPGVRLTDAAKAMNADFRIAMTGTPVENRLSDLWCITDAVHPAVLGELKGFSSDYERSPDPDRLRRLKASLDAWHGGRPPLLLRRLKQDRLPELPTPQESVRETPMPPHQRTAYEEAVAGARGADRPGAVLGALQKLRANLPPPRSGGRAFRRRLHRRVGAPSRDLRRARHDRREGRARAGLPGRPGHAGPAGRNHPAPLPALLPADDHQRRGGGGCPASAGGPVPGRTRGVRRDDPVPARRRCGVDADAGQPCRPSLALVEPGRGGPVHRTRASHRPDPARLHPHPHGRPRRRMRCVRPEPQCAVEPQAPPVPGSVDAARRHRRRQERAVHGDGRLIAAPSGWRPHIQPRRVSRKPNFLRRSGRHDEADITQIRPRTERGDAWQGRASDDRRPGRPSPTDRVNRQSWAPRPNALWVADFTYGATWQGFVYVAFVIDSFTRRIVGRHGGERNDRAELQQEIAALTRRCTALRDELLGGWQQRLEATAPPTALLPVHT